MCKVGGVGVQRCHDFGEKKETGYQAIKALIAYEGIYI
jgi:hypothetical protein